MSRVVLVIGAGRWGTHLIRNVVAAGATALVHDRHPERAEAAAATFGARAADLDAGLDAADAAIIATPADSHVSLARQALEAGLDVLVEKPFAPTAADAATLVRIAAERGRILAVDHTPRFDSRVTEALAALPGLGPHIRPPTAFDAARVGPMAIRSDTDVLGDLAPHDLAVLDAWLDEPLSWVEAEGAWNEAALVEARVRLGRPGFVARVHVSWVADAPRRVFTLTGGRDTLTVDTLAGTSTIEPLRALVDDFLEATDARRPPRCTGESAVRIAAWLDAARASIRAGGTRIELG